MNFDLELKKKGHYYEICIRELEKSISAKKWSNLKAKVPSCEKRTLNTYNTLIELLKVV